MASVRRHAAAARSSTAIRQGMTDAVEVGRGEWDSWREEAGGIQTSMAGGIGTRTTGWINMETAGTTIGEDRLSRRLRLRRRRLPT